MKRQPTIFFLILFLLSPFTDSQGYKFKFITVSDIVKKIKNRFSEIESYQANFKITTERQSNKTYNSGLIKYKKSNNMLIEFHNPWGQKIVSNRNTMWIYIPSMNVVAEQDLKSNSASLFSSGTRSGLNRLFSKYHYKFASKEQPEEQIDGTKKYTLFLKQKESRSGFRKIKLWVSDDYIIHKAYGESTTGNNITLELTNIMLDVDLPNGIFKFDVPSKAKIIKNPMVSEE